MDITLSQLNAASAPRQEKNGPLTTNEAFFRGGPTPVGSVDGLYLHIPFCFHKCHYCDFYSIVDNHDRQADFTTRLIAEIAVVAPTLADSPLESIFIGGGTPTLLRPELWEALLHAIRREFAPSDATEFTVEANPETVTAELSEILVRGGVNRVSIGSQSFNHTHLKTLERWHDPANVGRTVRLIREAGIRNFNLDLIFGIPGQTLQDWANDLDAALALEPTHLSCYSLMYEPNTPLTKKMRAGLIDPIDQDVEAAMYEHTMDTLAAAGFEHYEISNWARRSSTADHRCRHNLLYWHNANWWAFGPSASGHLDGARWKNIPRLGEYLDHGPFTRITDFERLDIDGRIGERFMLGLRLLEGMPLEEVSQLLCEGRRAEQRAQAIERGISGELLTREDGRLRLTRRGLMLADGVLTELI